MRKSILALLCIVVLLIAGCGNKPSSSSVSSSLGAVDENGAIQLKFRDELTIDKLKQLNGKQVKIVGFMATLSPLNGEYIYLMNMPYQNCPFCVPNTNQLANTMAVYAVKGKPFPFEDTPITVTGKFESGDFTDMQGYRYGYRIVDASYEKADIKGLEADIQLYTAVVSQGYGLKFTSVLNEIYKVVNYKETGTPEDQVKIINKATVNEIKAIFANLDQKAYAEPIATVAKLEKLVDDVNALVEKKDFATLRIYQEQAKLIYDQFYAWLIKPNM
jgi:uncharacterized lipoprotein NlpE involved in copper resistance